MTEREYKTKKWHVWKELEDIVTEGILHAITAAVWPILSTAWNYKIINSRRISNLKKENSIIFMPNHTSQFDPIFSAATSISSTGKFPYQIGKSSLPKALKMLRLIPISRPKELRKGKDTAKNAIHNKRRIYEKIIPELLEKGENLVVYPQARTSSQYDPAPISIAAIGNVIKGISAIDKRYREIPIKGVPTRIKYHRPLRRVGPLSIPRLRDSVSIEFGEPINLNDYEPSNGDVIKVVKHLKKELEGLVGENE